MRQLGLQVSDLDPIGRGYLNLFCRAAAKVELMDSYAAEHGFLDEEGKPRGFASLYFTALNSARGNLQRLEQHIRARDGGDELSTILREHYR